MHAGQKLYMKRFALIKSGEFLCTLSVAPPAVEMGLRLTGEDLNMFETLTTQRVKFNIIKAVKKLLTLRQKTGGVVAHDASSDDDVS